MLVLSLRSVRSFVVASVLTGLLAACGSLPRDTAPIRLSDTILSRGPDPRLDLSDDHTREALGQAIEAAAKAGGHTPIILALSGGGANGAYGAGVLTGWSEQGDRPDFDLVTGVSTGALSAPFAFLGQDWDETLRHSYTDGKTEALLSWRSVAAFFAPSLLSPRVLNDLVRDQVTPEMLRRVAQEHAKGRRLLVVTTNLDAEEAVIWDMGMIASQGDGNALALFRRVLLASASIPGVFPPVLIAAVQEDGSIVREMHVDGGVTIPFLASPGRPLSGRRSEPPAPGLAAGTLFIIINGQSTPHYAVTSGRIPAILGRTYTTSSKATTVRELVAATNLAFSENLNLLVTEIPPELEASSLDFHRANMEQMYELGRQRVERKKAWRVLNDATHDSESAGRADQSDDLRVEQEDEPPHVEVRSLAQTKIQVSVQAPRRGLSPPVAAAPGPPFLYAAVQPHAPCGTFCIETTTYR